jgi:hypothetical protein
LDIFVLTSLHCQWQVERDIVTAMSSLAPVAFHVDRGFTSGMGFLHQFLVNDGSMIDVSVITEENPNRFDIQPTMKVLVDINGQFTHLAAAAKSYSDSTDLQHDGLLQTYTGSFYVYAFTFLKVVKKNELWRAIYTVEKMRNVLFSIVRLSLRQYSPFLRRSEDDIEAVIPAGLQSVLSSYRTGYDATTLKVAVRDLLEALSTVDDPFFHPDLSKRIQAELAIGTELLGPSGARGPERG